MEVYYALKINSSDEILMALLTQFDFESYEEYEDYFIAYIQKPKFDDEVRSEVEQLTTKYTTTYTIEEIQPQNWNAIWESSFQPVVVGEFCQVRADFHPPKEGVTHDLIINPKMAFGTGHHATTHMMIQQMEDIDFTNKTVFDFGCGTGILAVLASKQRAHSVDAIDIEKESYLSTIENAEVNGVFNVLVLEGDLDRAPDKKYDIILANINRNILIKYAPQLIAKLNAGGNLLVSGILEEDASSVEYEYVSFGLVKASQNVRDGWACIEFRA